MAKLPKNADDFERATIMAQLDAAVEDTNKEIAASAWGDDEEVTLDPTGDRSLETMGEGLAGEHEDDEVDDETGGENEDADDETGESDGESDEDGESEDEDTSAGEGEADGAKPKPSEPEGRVPSARLREQTDARRAAEAERDALKTRLEQAETQSRQEIAGLKSQFEAVLAAFKAGQKPAGEESKPPAKPKLSDLLFENPDGFTDELTGRVDQKVTPIAQQVSNLGVMMSLKFAGMKYGDTFKSAIEELGKLDQQNPENNRLALDLYNSPDPGEALMAWHNRNVTLREVGPDPAAFKERIAKETREALAKDPEFRKQLLAELQAQAENDGTGRPNTTVRLPRSLNGAAGTSRDSFVPSSPYGDSQEGIFQSAWDDR